MASTGSSPVPQERADRALLVLGVMLALSVAGHLGGLVVLRALPKDKPPERIEVEMIIKEPPPPPPPPKEEPKPEPPPPKAPPPKIKIAEVPKIPQPKEPPPPNEEPPKEPPKVAPLVVGIAMSNQSDNGSFNVSAGNTAYGKMEKTAADPGQVQAYRAPKYAPPGTADTEPEQLGEFKPPYPKEATAAGIEGLVRLRVKVDETGKVVEVTVIKGVGYGLDEAARDGMRRTRFKPATKNGEPVGTTITFDYHFELD
jgi:periplasmic protein TonB